MHSFWMLRSAFLPPGRTGLWGGVLGCLRDSTYFLHCSRKGESGYCTHSFPRVSSKNSIHPGVVIPSHETLSESPLRILKTTAQVARKNRRGHAQWIRALPRNSRCCAVP